MSDTGKFVRALETLNERNDWREAMTEDEESAVLEALTIASQESLATPAPVSEAERAEMLEIIGDISSDAISYGHAMTYPRDLGSRKDSDIITDKWTKLKQLATRALSPPGSRHEWDRAGERCLKCGDKDWFAGPVCTGRATANRK